MVLEQFNPLIFDLGSSTVRAGWAGHDQPKFVESSYLGRKSDGSLDPVPYRFLNSKRASESVSVERTLHFDGSEWILDKECLGVLADTLLYSTRGLQNTPLERPVFATIPTGASSAIKRSYYEHFIESAEVPAFFVGDSSVLAMYAAGRVSGVCVDIGASALTVARVTRGEIADAGIHATAGDAIDNVILSRVDGIEAGSNIPESLQEQTRLALAREIKHGACKCSHHALPPPPTPSGSRRGARKAPLASPTHKSDHVAYKLPDGTEIDVGGVQEYAAETLFIATSEYPGLTEAVSSVLADEDDKFVLLTGGSAHFHGLHTRLVHELEASKANVFPFAQWTHRNHSSFLGASILASLSSFASLWVTPSSYLENGVDRLIAQS